MPTVQQILDDVKIRYPAAAVLADATLLNFGNEILRKVWKFMNEDEIYRFNIIANQATYSLPTDGLAYDKIDLIDIADDTTLETYTPHTWRGLDRKSVG